MNPGGSATLLGDVGGTYSRFALAGAQGRPEHIRTYTNDEFSEIGRAIQTYLEEVRAQPALAVLALAAPISGEDIALTNRGWQFRLSDLARELGIPHMYAVNDFEALAWALPRLNASDLRPLGKADGGADTKGARAVLGPGTGLGVAALVRAGAGWQAVASEGGHRSFGPDAADEDAVFLRLREQGRVSSETILSGPGLARLHRAMHPQTEPLAPETIVAHAVAGDRLACATVRLFVRLLGRFAGDIALTFKATGGVYIAGGVALALGALFDEDIFREAFAARSPHQALVKAIPTYLISYPYPGLIGCAGFAQAAQALRERGSG